MKKLSERSARLLYALIAIMFAYIAFRRFSIHDYASAASNLFMCIAVLLLATGKAMGRLEPLFIGALAISILVLIGQAFLS